MLTPEEMVERLRPKCVLLKTKYKTDTYPHELGDCGSFKRATCPKCEYHNKIDSVCDGCNCDEDKIDECQCETYYCRQCSRYVQNPQQLPSCIGYPIYGSRGNLRDVFLGFSNEKKFKELGLDFELAKRETNHPGW
jgi:hypothetical protein